MEDVRSPELNANLAVDADRRVRQIQHTEEPWESTQASPLMAAVEYLQRMSGVLDVPAPELQTLHQPVSFVDPREQGIEYRLGEQKDLFDSTTFIFNQTYLNVPVWRAGIALTVKHNPNRIVLVSDTSQQGMEASLPSRERIEEHRRLFALAAADQHLRAAGLEDQLSAAGLAEDDAQPRTAAFVRRVLGRDTAEDAGPDDARVIRGRFFIYRYDASARLPRQPDEGRPGVEPEQAETDADGHPDNHPMPVLPLPPVPASIEDGKYYLVSEVTFSLTTPEYGPLNWRALVEVETGAVLLLEPLVGALNGMVFRRDPISSTGNAANGPGRPNTVLNPLRSSVELPNLDAPVNGVQSLRGRFARVANVNAPNIAPPTRPEGAEFSYDARTNDFAAVSAYYHTDRFFALIESLGFPINVYFNGTTFPVRVDHRDFVGQSQDTINAWCVGNGAGGIDFAGYALNDLADTVNPIGRACDSRVHLHELGGHGILYEHVGTANFRFAHSAGDSLSVILHDPDSQAPDRFRYAPWNPSNPRRIDRDVAQGWAWGGSRDDRGYGSEEILATTMFRVYRSIGGDSADQGQKQFASRMAMYLILRAISTLTPATNPTNALGFANALMAVDLLNWTTEGVYGGAYNKVIRWAFEKQGLYQAPGAATPVAQAGRPPSVDVYLDDGRRGEYPYQAVFWNNPSVWNRRAADGGTTHQEPTAGVTNYAYARIRNRGTQTAQNVRVRGFHNRPGGGVIWPDDFQPLTTASLAAGNLSPGSAEERIVGPFAWVPVADAQGADSLLMVVSADGDTSNVDHFTAGGSIPAWRLVPNDNNIGLRNVQPEPGVGEQPGSGGAWEAVGMSAARDVRAVAPLLELLGLSARGRGSVRIRGVTLRVELDDETASAGESAAFGAGPYAADASTPPARAAAIADARWGMRRHAAIATAAMERLRSGTAASEILRILEQSGEASLGEAARWADRLRGRDRPRDPATDRFLGERRNRGYSSWHYVNLPLGLDGYDRARHPEFTRADDVVQIILLCIESLRNPGPRARFEEIIALRWLAHLVGDVHQPVHVGCGYIAHAETSRARLVTAPEAAVGLPSDHGGNDLLLPNGANLHSFWDSQLGPDLVPDPVEAITDEPLVRRLVEAPGRAADTAADAAGLVTGWANVSLAAARAAYDGLRITGYQGRGDYTVAWEGEESYRQRCAPIVSERMGAAAANLAALLDSLWP